MTDRHLRHGHDKLAACVSNGRHHLQLTVCVAGIRAYTWSAQRSVYVMVTVCRLRAAPAFHAGNLLSMNYDRQLLSMSQEVQHWERLRMAVPYIAMEIQAQREKYRVLRDNMLMLVHDYNKVSTYVQGLHMLVHCSACARDACTSAPSSSPAVMASAGLCRQVQCAAPLCLHT